MSWIGKSLPYAILLFTIGFGWFGLAPLVPYLMHALSATEAEVLIILSSAYGGAFIVVGLISGWLSAKVSLKGTIILAAVLSFIGLVIRVVSPDYIVFLIASVIAALAYPLAMAPIGAVAVSIDKTKTQSITGMSLGGFFLGMAGGALLNPIIYKSVALSGTLAVTAILSLLALIYIIIGGKDYPSKYQQRSLRGVFKWGMVNNWYSGFIVPATTVMFGGIATGMLLLHKLGAMAAVYGGLFGALAFIGSALGTIILPAVFEKANKEKIGYISMSFMAFVFVLVMAYSLSFTVDIALIAAAYFFFGLFADTLWSMELEGVTKYVEDPAKAGFATSLMQVAGNFGVFIIPALLGPLFSVPTTVSLAIGVVAVLFFILFVASFFLRTEKVSPSTQPKPADSKPKAAKPSK